MRTLPGYLSDLRVVPLYLGCSGVSLCSLGVEIELSPYKYLRVILSQDSVEANPTKIKEVANWPEPHDRREVWQFLEFCNFYWKFIPGFAKVAKPLMELIGKKKWK